MTEITLARALKLKNRLTGQLAKLGQRAMEHNSYPEDTPAAYNTDVVLAEYCDVQDRLVELKAKIQIANAPIQGNIVRMGELRSQIALLQGMSVVEGPVYDRYNREGAEARQYVACVNKQSRDTAVEEIEASIDVIQDEIDTHNATTRIELTFDA